MSQQGTATDRAVRRARELLSVPGFEDWQRCREQIRTFLDTYGRSKVGELSEPEAEAFLRKFGNSPSKARTAAAANAQSASPDAKGQCEGLETVAKLGGINGVMLTSHIKLLTPAAQTKYKDELVRRSQAVELLAVAMKDRLPKGHIILEQADTLDGRVSQTVHVEATGEEYERIVHAEEAYGDDE